MRGYDPWRLLGLAVCIVSAGLVICLLVFVARAAADVLPPPANAQIDVLRAQLARERRAHALERLRLARRVRALSTEARRLREGARAFTVADTFTAARLAAVVGGWPEAGALRVANCESHYQPGSQNATSLGGSHATGSWQVLWPGTWVSTAVGRAFPSAADAMNPYLNAFAALAVWKRNRGTFSEWADVCARQG